MTGLSDAERDACDVMQALAGLAAVLRRSADDLPGLDPYDPALADLARGDLGLGDLGLGDLGLGDPRRLLLGIAEDGGVAAARVLTYLRELRGAGDGEAVAVAPRLGQWRDWVPPRGNLFAAVEVAKPNEVPQPRRSDPGE